MSATAIVIGAGINGLVTAHYLARAGRSVRVLEANPERDAAWPDAGAIDPRVLRDLGLDTRVLSVAAMEPWITVPLPDGGRLQLHHDIAQTAAAIRHIAPRDAERWPAFCQRMHDLADVLLGLATAPPPDFMTRQPRALMRLARVAWDTRRRGRQTTLDLLRILPMSIAELLDDWFENDTLKAVIGAAGVTHLHQGPRAGGTALVMLHQHMGCPAGVFRPPVSRLRRALAGAAPGRFDIRYDATAVRILLRDGRAAGVVLEDGEEIEAPIVACSLDTRTTLLRLVGPDALGPDAIQAALAIRSRGVTALLSLRLADTPDFHTLFVGRDLDYLERAYDDAKYGRVSQQPWIEARVDPMVDPMDGHAHVHVHAQYAPHTPAAAAWSDSMREALGRRVVELLQDSVPDMPAVLDMSVRVPPDLGRAFGWPRGQPHHAEPALDQWLFMRPLPGYGYGTPVPNLYLCGPASHPGLYPLGAAGANAAATILGRAD